MENCNSDKRKKVFCSGLQKNNVNDEVYKKLTEVYARLKCENQFRIVINGEKPNLKPPRVVNLDFSKSEKENFYAREKSVKVQSSQGSIIKRVKYNI